MGTLGKILEMSGPSDSLTLRWQCEAGAITFQGEGRDQDRIFVFDLKLMHIKMERAEIPSRLSRLVRNSFQASSRNMIGASRSSVKQCTPV